MVPDIGAMVTGLLWLAAVGSATFGAAGLFAGWLIWG